jgi:hypothetical protein
MRRKLYFTLPDVKHCQQLVTELKKQGLAERHIHVIARGDIPLAGLHEASTLQKTELAHGLELGAGIGGIAGLLGGLLAITFPPAGLVLGGGAIFGTTLAGASFGTIVSGLIARDIANHELEAFQTQIANGQILLILDILTQKVEEIAQLIKTTHPEAEIGIVKSNTTSQHSNF